MLRIDIFDRTLGRSAPRSELLKQMSSTINDTFYNTVLKPQIYGELQGVCWHGAGASFFGPDQWNRFGWSKANIVMFWSYHHQRNGPLFSLHAALTGLNEVYVSLRTAPLDTQNLFPLFASVWVCRYSDKGYLSSTDAYLSLRIEFTYVLGLYRVYCLHRYRTNMKGSIPRPST